MEMIFLIPIVLLLISICYLLLLAFASIPNPSPISLDRHLPASRFFIIIPAHDEATVIGDTVRQLLRQDYPSHLYSIHIVADHCSDSTAEVARDAGATVHERHEGPRLGKGSALAWLFDRLIGRGDADAVIIFDADTLVDAGFLHIMDYHLCTGKKVIQGQHRISNPDQGWFPALTWAMFLIDNRFQNLGRTNLGWSSKNMGDSICLQEQVLCDHGWGSGLTEDYQLRLKLLSNGIKIGYEPAAIGRGEAPLTWQQAHAQKKRWLRGTVDACRELRKQLLLDGIRRRDAALIDGALQTYLPSYSTLSMLSVILFLAAIFVQLQTISLSPACIWVSAAMVVALMLYPLLGLFLEKAPPRAYLVILSGPIFIIWRTWLAIKVRLSRMPVHWVRTDHGVKAKRD